MTIAGNSSLARSTTSMTKKSWNGFSRQWIITGLIILAGAALFYKGYRDRQWKKDHVLIELKPFQTAKGWGYNIYTDGKVYIHQDIIPALPTNRGFRTKEDALAVGTKVYERLKSGQVPMVTAKEVQDMGITPQP
jgi:hypothetical protein